jgi:hypothetical protein
VSRIFISKIWTPVHETKINVAFETVRHTYKTNNINATGYLNKTLTTKECVSKEFTK